MAPTATPTGWGSAQVATKPRQSPPDQFGQHDMHDDIDLPHASAGWTKPKPLRSRPNPQSRRFRSCPGRCRIPFRRALVRLTGLRGRLRR